MVLRIAIISEHASPLAVPGGADSGGQNVYVGQLARHLAMQGQHVDVFTRRDNTVAPEIVHWNNSVRVIHMDAGPARFVRKEDLLEHMPQFTAGMTAFCRRHGIVYDLTHANFFMSAQVAADLKQTFGIPFAVTFHALGRVRRLYQGGADAFPITRFVMEDRAMAEADAIIAECPQDREDLIQFYHANPHKISIIPCGFDPVEFMPVDKIMARDMLGLPREEHIVLQLGRLVPRKGIDTVISGFAQAVHKHGMKAKLVIVGGESEKPDPESTPEIGRLMSIARAHDVMEQVMFAGRRGRDVLKYFYGAADVFVTMPWYEPFGMTPLESMACGTPVIGANVGGIKHTIADNETGYLIPPCDDSALGDKLAYLLKNSGLRETMGRNAVERVHEHFTWEKVTQTVSTLYKSILLEKSLPETAVEWQPDLST